MSFIYKQLSSKTRYISYYPKCKYSTSLKQSNISKPTDGYILKNSTSKISMPALGFGTWGVDKFGNDIMAKSTDYALKIGYRHIDCAKVYKNEKEIGSVLKDHFNNGLNRSQIFITSKLFNDEHDNPIKGIESSLKDLNIDYLDSYLIHWPFPNIVGRTPKPFNIKELYNTYKNMYKLTEMGLTKSVGLCNVTVTKLKELIKYCNIDNIDIPSIHQCEIHLYLQQNNMLQFCNDNNIVLTAAMPLGSPERPQRFKRDDDPLPLENKIIKKIANEIGCSVAQVLIKWHLQRGIVVIPKGTEEWMIEQNMKALDIQLSDEHMDIISKEDKNYRFARGEVYGWKDNQPWQELWDYE